MQRQHWKTDTEPTIGRIVPGERTLWTTWRQCKLPRANLHRRGHKKQFNTKATVGRRFFRITEESYADSPHFTRRRSGPNAFATITRKLKQIFRRGFVVAVVWARHQLYKSTTYMNNSTLLPAVVREQLTHMASQRPPRRHSCTELSLLVAC